MTGNQIQVNYEKEFHYFDVWHGIQLNPEIIDNKAMISFPIEANGFGAILYFKPEDSPKEFSPFLSTMKEYSSHSLSYYSASNLVLKKTMTKINATKLYKSPPEDMISILSANYTFSVTGNEIEGGNDPGVDVQYEWEQFPQRAHKHVIQIKKFFIDKTPVTSKQFKKFMDSTKYSPKDGHDFRRDWLNGNYRDG